MAVNLSAYANHEPSASAQGLPENGNGTWTADLTIEPETEEETGQNNQSTDNMSAVERTRAKEEAGLVFVVSNMFGGMFVPAGMAASFAALSDQYTDIVDTSYENMFGMTLLELFDVLYVTECWVNLNEFFRYKARRKQAEQASKGVGSLDDYGRKSDDDEE
jgi:hypothetical protein